jgi:hypothetical protein
MKTRSIPAIVILVVSLTVVFSTAYAGQDNKSTVKALNGLGFSDFKGYEDWQDVAVSQTERGSRLSSGSHHDEGVSERYPRQRQAFSRRLQDCKDRVEQEKGSRVTLFYGGAGRLEIGFVPREDSKKFKDSSGWGMRSFCTMQALKRSSLTATTSHSGQKFVISAIRL